MFTISDKDDIEVGKKQLSKPEMLGAARTSVEERRTGST